MKKPKSYEALLQERRVNPRVVRRRVVRKAYPPFNDPYESRFDQGVHSGYLVNGSLKIEEDEWLTTKEAAKYLKIRQDCLLRLVSNGKVPYYKLGRSNRYLKSELRKLVLGQPRGGLDGYQVR